MANNNEEIKALLAQLESDDEDVRLRAAAQLSAKCVCEQMRVATELLQVKIKVEALMAEGEYYQGLMGKCKKVGDDFRRAHGMPVDEEEEKPLPRWAASGFNFDVKP